MPWYMCKGLLLVTRERVGKRSSFPPAGQRTPGEPSPGDLVFYQCSTAPFRCYRAPKGFAGMRRESTNLDNNLTVDRIQVQIVEDHTQKVVLSRFLYANMNAKGVATPSPSEITQWSSSAKVACKGQSSSNFTTAVKFSSCLRKQCLRRNDAYSLPTGLRVFSLFMNQAGNSEKTKVRRLGSGVMEPNTWWDTFGPLPAGSLAVISLWLLLNAHVSFRSDLNNTGKQNTILPPGFSQGSSQPDLSKGSVYVCSYTSLLTVPELECAELKKVYLPVRNWKLCLLKLNVEMTECGQTFTILWRTPGTIQIRHPQQLSLLSNSSKSYYAWLEEAQQG